MQHVQGHTLFTEFDIYLFRSGKHYRLYKKLGSHPIEIEGKWGTYFAVWAPNAESVSVMGDFNGWNTGSHHLNARWDSSGIWEGWIPDIGKGTLYKYAIRTQEGNLLEKGDPFAHYWEMPPKTASIVWDLYYEWDDRDWMEARKKKAGKPQPMSVYEVHLGSWRKTDNSTRSLSYRELADDLVGYVKDTGFTHVEFLPPMEHPFFPSWGYQITGYFAPTSRFGQPEDFMYLVEAFHRAGIGVLIDWVPSHFPNDSHGLAMFDGTHLYEHADPRQGFHPDWKSAVYNYGRNEVRNFLISNAIFWLDQYHIDGLRVDAVASMLYLDYSREEGEWIPNKQGGRENLEAVDFLREFNETVYGEFPDVITIAEESTSWSGVSHPTYTGGLGFGQKWMMGWMHDTLEYFKRDPVHRKYHHGEITFSLIYAFTENFMLPLSHDEVVHGKGALIDRMPGDEWQRFANLRLLFGYMYMHPGTKLLFMGDEFGQTSEWNIERGLEWWLLEHAPHQGLRHWIKAINTFYRKTSALYERQFEGEGFAWIDHGDAANSLLSFIRKGERPEDQLVVLCNFTPVTRYPHRLGVPLPGTWRECLNSDHSDYGGTGQHLNTHHEAQQGEWSGQPYWIEVAIPPLGISVFCRETED